MPEWWSYRPEDLLLFSPRTYWRMFELHNAAVWPMQLLALAAIASVGLLVFRRRPDDGRWIAFILAVLWAAVAWSFFWHRYATINWAAVYVAPAFVFEALLLVIAGTLLAGIRFERRRQFERRRIGSWVGGALTAFAVIGQPLFAPVLGRPWASAEIFGVAPDPTAIGTLGLLLTARGRLLPLLFVVPVLWCLLSAATLWTMRASEGWVPMTAAVLAVAASAWEAIARRKR
jgi:hypothetical protein